MPCIDTVQGLLFLPCNNTATHKRSQRVLPCPCNYTAHAAKQHTRLYSGFSCDCTRSTARDTRPTQAAIIPPAPRWRGIHTPGRAQPIPDTTATHGRCAGQHSRPIIIMYIRVQRPRKPGGVSSTDPAQLLRGQRLHLYRVSPAACNLAPSTRRAARNH